MHLIHFPLISFSKQCILEMQSAETGCFSLQLLNEKVIKMGIILFVFLTVMEAALAVLTLTKQKKKTLWHRNCTILRAAEIILVLCLLPAAGQKWRFAGCIILLVLRLFFAGILFCINRRREGKKTLAGTAAGAVMSTLLIGFSLVPAFVFTGYTGLKTTGPYTVQETQAILTDRSRLEVHEQDGSYREIPVHFYYPQEDAENCPLILFAHGSFGYYQSNTSLYMELASNGYAVVSIDHPYYAFFTRDTNGKIIPVDMAFMQTAIDVQNGAYTEEESFILAKEWMDVRTADENFVLDTLKAAGTSACLNDAWYIETTDAETEILRFFAMADMNKIGLAGHSIGGAAAVQLGRERDDIAAAVDMDGTMIGERVLDPNGGYTYNEEPYPIPLLVLDNAGHWEDYTQTISENGQPYVNRFVLDNALDAREAHFSGTEHMDFTDLPLLSPTLASMLGKGSADPEEFVPRMNAVILQYFDHYLKGKEAPETEPWNA